MFHSSAVSPQPLRSLLCYATVDGGWRCVSRFHFLKTRLKNLEVVIEDIFSTIVVCVVLAPPTLLVIAAMQIQPVAGLSLIIRRGSKVFDAK